MIIFLFLVFVSLITYLLIRKFIGPVAFTSLFIVFILSSIAMCGFDRLQVLDLKNLTVTLKELKEIREDVYAKQKNVQKLSNQFFKISSQIMSKFGTWDGDFSIDELIAFRNEAKDTLMESNTNQAKVKELLLPLEERIWRDSRAEIVKKMEEVVSEHSSKGASDMPFEQIKEGTHKLVDKDDYDGLLEYLNRHNLADGKLQLLIQKRKVIKSRLM
jgi:hypothetical protein